jgi:hypothetical protein
MNIAIRGIQIKKFLVIFQSFQIVLGDQIILGICKVAFEGFLVLPVYRAKKLYKYAEQNEFRKFHQ